MLTNTELVKAFIESSVRQQEVLLANPSFRAESLCGINQLISKKDGVQIKVNSQESPLQFYLRHNSPHTLALRSLLNRHQFLLAESASDSRFEAYRYFSVRRGYEFNCNTGRALWKNWRAIKRLSSNASKVLVKQGTSWAEIQQIGVSNELIFIETADKKEVVHNFSDSVLWLNKVA
ncbi:MAG: hypothetical protein ACFB0D_14265 [Phormidesmis sp.]